MTISEGQYQASLVDPEPWGDRDEDAIYESSANHPLYDDDAHDPQFDEPREILPGYWQAASGLIKISEMTDSHLQNAIAWAGRNDIERSKMEELVAEATRKGLL